MSRGTMAVLGLLLLVLPAHAARFTGSKVVDKVHVIASSADSAAMKQVGGAGGRCPCTDCLAANRLLRDASNDATVAAAVGFVHEGCGGCRACTRTGDVLVQSLLRWLAGAVDHGSLACEGAGTSCGHPLLLTSRASLQSPLGDPTMCAMCTFVVDQVKTMLNDTSVQASIKEKALEVCSKLPSADLIQNCKDLVNTYEPVIVDWIEKVDTASLCTMAGACLATAPQPPPLPRALVAALADIARQMESAAANDSCDVCQMAVLEAHTLIMNPDVRASLTNYTHDVCALMGGPFADTCNDYVDQYSPALFDALEKYLADPSLCATLGICQA